MIQKLKSPMVSKFIKFGMVGGAGAVINTIILWGLTMIGMEDLIAVVIATELAIIFNFFANHMFTFKDRQEGHLGKKFLTFQGVSLVGLACTLLIVALLKMQFGTDPKWHLLVWNLIAIIISSLVNFTLNMKFTWNTEVRS